MSSSQEWLAAHYHGSMEFVVVPQSRENLSPSRRVDEVPTASCRVHDEAVNYLDVTRSIEIDASFMSLSGISSVQVSSWNPKSAEHQGVPSFPLETPEDSFLPTQVSTGSPLKKKEFSEKSLKRIQQNASMTISLEMNPIELQEFKPSKENSRPIRSFQRQGHSLDSPSVSFKELSREDTIESEKRNHSTLFEPKDPLRESGSWVGNREIEAVAPKNVIEQRKEPKKAASARSRILKTRTKVNLLCSIIGLSVLTLFGLGSSISGMIDLRKQSLAIEKAVQQKLERRASQVERSIRSHMLKGRADLARALVSRLRSKKGPYAVEVVRPNRTLAFADFATKEWIENRITNPKVMDWIGQKQPNMLFNIQKLVKVALPNLNRSQTMNEKRYDRFQDLWSLAIRSGQPKVKSEWDKGTKTMSVLWPIRGEKSCQSCHGVGSKNASKSSHSSPSTRAILVVRHSLKKSESKLQKLRDKVLVVGLASFSGLILVLLFVRRLFGHMQKQTNLSIDQE